MTTTAAGPDVGQLQTEKLPEAPFPGGRRPPYRFYLDPAVHAGVWQHAGENINVEICGVLVGRLARDADGPFADVTAFIRGEAAANKLAEVTFTHDTWARINQEMDTKFADKKIVGWYHSHPDFGVFLSDRDRFIQEHFFCGPGQVAYVVDPVRGTEGVFVWKAGKPTMAPHYWVGDRLQVATAAGEEWRTRHDGASEAARGPSPSQSSGMTSATRWLAALTAASWYGVVFLLGLFLSGYLTHAMTDLERFQIARDAKVRAMIDYGIRPGLGEELDGATAQLLQAVRATRSLADDHLKGQDDPAETKKKWQEVFDGLLAAANRMNQARVTYAPAKAETDRLRQLIETAKPPNATDRKPKDKPAKADAPRPGP